MNHIRVKQNKIITTDAKKRKEISIYFSVFQYVNRIDVFNVNVRCIHRI
jgi:hypothetical protein